MTSHLFTNEERALHAEVRELVQEALKKKSTTKSTVERTERRAYTPEHDVQILKVLKENGRAEQFGSSSTEEKRELCVDLCKDLKALYSQERTPDSLFYRITKLLKLEDIADLNYRLRGGNDSPKLKKEKNPEGASITTAKQEETDKVRDTETFDDNDFLD